MNIPLKCWKCLCKKRSLDWKHWEHRRVGMPSNRWQIRIANKNWKQKMIKDRLIEISITWCDHTFLFSFHLWLLLQSCWRKMYENWKWYRWKRLYPLLSQWQEDWQTHPAPLSSNCKLVWNILFCFRTYPIVFVGSRCLFKFLTSLERDYKELL